MKAFLYKSTSTMVLILTCAIMLCGQKSTNYTAIRNANIQIRSSFHNTPLAWATDTVDITVNKQTGEFQAKLLVDNLHYATANTAFNGATGENKGKYLILTGIIPVDDVLSNTNNAIDRKVEIMASFNDLEDYSSFTFTILKMPSGFSVMATGTISHSALEIENLSELEDDLMIILSFTGY
jgi:hypothetical protein